MTVPVDVAGHIGDHRVAALLGVDPAVDVGRELLQLVGVGGNGHRLLLARSVRVGSLNRRGPGPGT
ncbi:MAG: hypothetical protein AAGK32_08115, partial [Actinomycetota bacterium]